MQIMSEYPNKNVYVLYGNPFSVNKTLEILKKNKLVDDNVTNTEYHLPTDRKGKNMAIPLPNLIMVFWSTSSLEDLTKIILSTLEERCHIDIKTLKLVPEEYLSEFLKIKNPRKLRPIAHICNNPHC